MIPSSERVAEHLAAIVARGSVNLGGRAGVERLMLMLTRSCQLRCGYCFVTKTEGGQVMSAAIARRAIDLLMKSERPKLELQMFGGEPTSEWSLLTEVLDYVTDHPSRRGRPLEVILTSNGVLLDAERIRCLERYPVVVLLSVDGDVAVHRRFRVVHSGTDRTWFENDTQTHARISRAMHELRQSRVSWFANVVVPPAAASDVPARYRWALDHGVPRLQLNYAVGMRWTEAQMAEFIRGIVQVLRENDERQELVLFNWKSDCEPVILSDDLIVDVDGTVLHDGAIFLERSFGRLKQTYARGHVAELDAFDPLRWSLQELYEVMRDTYPAGSEERHILLQNMEMGAALDLVIQALTAELGRERSRGAVAKNG